jgi:group I intron endonuclease
MGYIYKIINMITKTMYIGQTINLEERWRGHKKINSNCRYLKHAFNKYGINNFKFELICICFDEDMNKIENEYIKKYNTLVPNGYNLREGGNSGRHNSETKKKISDSLRGKPRPCKGQIHTEETKKKISNALKNRAKSTRCSKEDSKPVLQCDIKGVFIKQFDSRKDAAKYINVPTSAVTKVCNGTRKSVKGFIFKYES